MNHFILKNHKTKLQTLSFVWPTQSVEYSPAIPPVCLLDTATIRWTGFLAVHELQCLTVIWLDWTGFSVWKKDSYLGSGFGLNPKVDQKLQSSQEYSCSSFLSRARLRLIQRKHDRLKTCVQRAECAQCSLQLGWGLSVNIPARCVGELLRLKHEG